MEEGENIGLKFQKLCEKPKIFRDTSAMTANKMAAIVGVGIVIIAFVMLKAGMKVLANFWLKFYFI